MLIMCGFSHSFFHFSFLFVSAELEALRTRFVVPKNIAKIGSRYRGAFAGAPLGECDLMCYCCM
jgi:hypothetical protein